MSPAREHVRTWSGVKNRVRPRGLEGGGDTAHVTPLGMNEASTLSRALSRHDCGYDHDHGHDHDSENDPLKCRSTSKYLDGLPSLIRLAARAPSLAVDTVGHRLRITSAHQVAHPPYDHKLHDHFGSIERKLAEASVAFA